MKKFFIVTAILSIMPALASAYSIKPVANATTAPSAEAMEFTKEVDLGLSVNWSGWDLNPTDSPLSASVYHWGEVKPKANAMVAPINTEYQFPCDISGTNYDAARYLWGEGWRMPTKAEVEELLALGSTYTNISYGGESADVHKVTGTNGNSIYFLDESSGESYPCLTASFPAGSGSFYAYRFYKDKMPKTYTVMRTSRGVTLLARAVKDRTPRTEKVTGIAQSDSIKYAGVGEKVYVWAVALPETAGNRWLDFTSSDESVATVDDYGCVTIKAKGEAVITISATDGSGVSTQCRIEAISLADFPELVDMGTGVMWTSKNLGAETTSAVGNYYRFGEIEAMSTAAYPFGLNTSLKDVEIKGNPLYDAATAALGEFYTTPSKQEFEELIANSNTSLVTIDGVKGVLYVSKTTGNKLFFPASGQKMTTSTSIWNSSVAYSLTSDYEENSSVSTTKVYVIGNTNSESLNAGSYYVPVRAVYKKFVKVTEIVLSKTQLTLTVGKEYTVAATVSPENAAEKRLKWKSSNEAVATVDAEGKITAVSAGNCVITVSATDASGVTAQIDVTVETPQYVDLGLSVMWGVSNLDATTEYEAGGYYRLGDLTPLSDAETPFGSYSEVEGITVAGNPEYDAVTAKKGDKWCTPTLEMIQELIRNCDIELGWNNDYNIGFYRFTSRINGNSIVIPCYGYYNSASAATPSDSDASYILSSTFVPYTTIDDPVKIYYLNGRSSKNRTLAGFYSPIRPVYKEVVEAESLEFDTVHYDVKVGEEFDVTYTLLPENVTDKRLTWESSDLSCCAVDENGHVTALEVGSCEITATASNGLKATCSVTVTINPEYVGCVDMGLSVMWGISNLGATTEYEAGGYYRLGDLTPLSDAKNPFGQYSGLGDKIVTGNPEYDAVTAKKGDKWCTPTREMFQELIDNCDITQDWSDEHEVGYFRFTSRINGNSIVIPCRGYYSRSNGRFPSESEALYTLTSTFVPSTNINDMIEIYYLYDKTLRENLLSNFYCPIRPVYKVRETVGAKSLELDMAHYDIKVGEEIDITYTLLPEDVTYKKLTWSCSEPNCCTIDENGHVTALGVGTCEITAITANGLKAMCTITVTTDPKDVAYVDMGTSVMWAESNLGAAKPSEIGDYYYLSNIIKDSKTNSWNLFGPNMVDSVKLVNDPRYDAATANLGLAWHIPTAEEMQELIDNCTITTHALDGVVGKLFTSKTTGNTLFFPQSGRKSYNVYNKDAVMSMTSSWKGQLNLILLDDELTSQSGDNRPLTRTEYSYTVRPVRSEAVEAERIEIAATRVENSSYQLYRMAATVYPENASCRNVTWTSSDPEVVSVSELSQPTLRNAIVSVHPAAEGNGPWEVVAHAVDGSGITAVYIIDNRPSSIEIVEIDLNMAYDVYDLLGRRVLVGMLYTDLRQQLKPGFYILAGQDGSRIKIKI